MYHNFLIHSSADGYLGCFHVLTIVNSAMMNTGVHVSLSIPVSSVFMPSSGIAESYKDTHRELEQSQCGPHTASTPHTRQWYLFAMFLPPHSTIEQVSLNKWPPSSPCVKVEIRHWRDLQTEEAKINKEGTALEVTGATDWNPVVSID